MSKSRNWLVTINYFNEQDMADIELMFERLSQWHHNELHDDDVEKQLCNYRYIIFGFEGTDEKSTFHPHIHMYIHYVHPVSMTNVLTNFTKHHNCVVIDNPLDAIEYCKGYEGKEHKLKDLEENVWLDIGTLPNGVLKKPKVNQTNLVMTAINEGKTIEEVCQLFPSFALHHYNKLKSFYERKKQNVETKFYYIDPDDSVGDLITYLHDAGIVEGKLAVCFEDLSELEAYEEYDTILYYGDYTRQLAHYALGYPMTYKYGYELRKIKPRMFIYHNKLKHKILPGYSKLNLYY